MRSVPFFKNMGVPLRVAMFSVPLSLQPPHYASLRSASLRWPLRALHSAHAVLPQKQGLQGLSLFFPMQIFLGNV